MKRAPARKGARRPETPPRNPRTLKTRARKLPQTGKTRTEEVMEVKLGTLEPGTPRYEILKVAIDFKRSWLELAARLSAVAGSGEWKEWGYRTVEAYAQHELHLRRDTAQKLLRSFSFLESHERSLLDEVREDQKPRALPSYQALDVLAEARQNPYMSERDYRDLRDHVFSNDPPASEVKKIMRERAPEPAKGEDDDATRLRRCLGLAERLYGLLMEDEKIPSRLSKSLEEVVGGLRQLIEE